MFDAVTDRVQKPILEAMHVSAEKHALASKGLLTCLPIDLDTFPHQALRDNRVVGELTTIENTIKIATLIRPRYPLITAFIEESEKDVPEADRRSEQIGMVLDSQQNVMVAHDHSEDVITFIMNSLALSNKQRERGTNFKSAVMASKMLDFLAVDLSNFGDFKKAAEDLMDDAEIPINSGLVFARDILGKGFDVQYLTIPKTQSTEGIRGMFTSAIESINGDSRSKIKQDFSPSAMKKRHTPIMLHSAVSGMINRILDVDQYEKTRRLNIYDIEVGENFSESAIDPEIEVLGSISPGISTFAERALTYAAVSKMHVNNPFLVVDRNPIALQKDKIDRVRELGRRQVQLLDSIDPRVTHIYDAKGNLPLVDLTGNELD